MSPEEILSRLLYRDALMLVINKPAGIPVHKGTGGGENLEQAFDELRFGLPRTPSLAHRLDRDTSGCLVLGRHRQALAKLAKLFEQGKIEKTYWAIVAGAPPQQEGVIDLPLEKQSEDSRRWHMQVAKSGGLKTVTHYRVLGQSAAVSWLEMKPLTGRTHQLRVHAAAIGCPILGDRIYNPSPADMMLALHARAIRIPLYPKKEAIDVSAPVPAHMVSLLGEMGWRGDD